MASLTTPPTDKTLGIDVSHWQGTMNWSMAKSKNVMWAIAKATDFIAGTTRGFVDSKVIENYKGMKYNGIITGGYCWLQPKVDPTLQARFYLDNFYNKYPTDLPPVLDFEDSAVNSWSDMLWRAQVWLDYVENATGRIPILYTSPGYMGHFDSKKTGFLSRNPLWLAHYIQRTYPSVPYPWSTYFAWQYTDKGEFPYYVHKGTVFYGKEYGAGSSRLDMNWYNGTLAQLQTFCGQEVTVPTPPTPPTVPTVLFYIKCNTAVLNIRSGSSTLYPIIGKLLYGQVKPVYEERGGWYRIDTDMWCSGYYTIKVEGQEVPSQPLFRARCVVNVLNKRSGAGTNYPIVGIVKYDEVVSVYEELNGWYRLAEKSQVWSFANSGSYLVKV